MTAATVGSAACREEWRRRLPRYSMLRGLPQLCKRDRPLPRNRGEQRIWKSGVQEASIDRMALQRASLVVAGCHAFWCEEEAAV
ncbi:hypothetical protein NDU88_002493 [Pleurodeles waltl]|uniref:Uncharacterized protein n=1 Tax=Pleurodeles waltl TaxID=8319 RepID=A0AAV7WLD8_PLEWA|nr:hypothetical protein NDU88_002493 [Pleurodeles waltl]